jgi:hypothetical protein
MTRRPGSATANVTNSPALSAHPIVPSPTPSDPSSSSPFHLDKSEIEHDVHTVENSRSEHNHRHGDLPSSFSHGRSSRPTTRASSADRSPGSDSSSVETPAHPSEEQQSRQLSIEVVDERGNVSQPPLPANMVQNITTTREEKGKGLSPIDISLTPSQRQEVASAIFVPSSPGAGQPLASKSGFVPETDRDNTDSTDKGIASPTDSSPRGKPVLVSPPEEPYSPSSEYTKEGGLTSEDSHIQRASTLTVSDGGFGIGLSLLQGLANGERDSRAWSESEAEDASLPRRTQHVNPATSNIQTPVFTSTTTANVKAQRQSALSNISSVEGGQKARSESDHGDGGYGWDDDDLLDDYRYSRYSMASKASKQSRASTIPSVMQSLKMPPLPDDPRPSLDGQQSLRSTSTSPQPLQNPVLLSAKPLNIVKNNSKGSSPVMSPTTPIPREEERGVGASVTPLGMASALRQRIDEENEKSGTNKMEELTPRPSAEKLSQASSMAVLPASSSNDYNGDESGTESFVEPGTTAGLPNDPLSPISTAGSTNSLFLPHPGAPKPVMSNGQIAPRTAAIHMANANATTSPSSYWSASQATSPSSPETSRNAFNGNRGDGGMSMPSVVSLVTTLAMAAARARNVKGTTLYGTTQTELLTSPGPVPIVFSLDGHPPSPRVMHDADFGFPRHSPRSPASPVGLGITNPSGGNDSSGQPIPRANFFPNKGAPRPRSRSFSGFSVNDAEVLIPMTRKSVNNSG